MVGSPSFIELQRTQPISAEKLPLPDGAATSANQTATQSPVGATAAPAAATVVQGNDAGTPVPVSIRGLVVLTTGTTINISGAYNSTPPVLVDGTENNLFQLDANANLKTVIQNWPATQPVSGTVGISGSVAVTGTFFPATQPVSGTFWQTTQPVSAASLPLPAGAATAANQPALNADGGSLAHVTNFPATQPVSLATNTPDVTDRAARLLGHVSVDNASLAVTLATSPAVPQGTAAATTAGWPITSGQQADTTGTFTNATQTASVTTGSLLGYETVTVSISGTYGTATGVFEVSDDGGTTWYAAQAARSDSATVDSGYTSLTNINRLWILPVNGADQFRVRSTAVASGTVNVRISPSAASTADSAIVSVANTVAAQGDVPAAATDSGNPQKIGGLAKTANPTAVADGQRVNAVFDKLGKLVVIHSLRELRGVQQTTIGVNTETTIVTAGAVGVFNDLYALVIANTSATAVSVTLKDATAGTARGIFQIPASATTICFQLPASDGIPQAAAAANWTLTSSAAVTSLQVMALYVKNL